MYSGSHADFQLTCSIHSGFETRLLLRSSLLLLTKNILFINMCSSVWPDKFLHCLFDCTVDSSENSISVVNSRWSSRRGYPGGGAAGSTCLPAVLGRERLPSALPACRPPPTASSSSSTPRRKERAYKVCQDDINKLITSSQHRNVLSKKQISKIA